MSIENKNAVIKSAKISNYDHGLLTINLDLDYGGTDQGFGGYCLFKNGADAKDTKGYTGHFIDRCLKVAGVSSWDQLEGQTIRVKAEHSKVHAIGHILEDIWFDPSEEFRGADDAESKS